MFSKYISILIITLAGSVILGCGQNPIQNHPTLLDKNWGRSFEMMKYNQILNAEADKNLDPIDKINGKAAKSTMDRYQEGFAAEAPEESYTVNLGTISGIGQQKLGD